MIILKNWKHLFIILERTFKHVEGTIIFVINQILKIVFEGHSQFISVIIFSNFKFDIFIFLIEVLESPILLNIPILSAAWIDKSLPWITTGKFFFSNLSTKSSTDS